MNRNNLDCIISEAGAAFGVPGLKTNSDGALGLQVDDAVVGLRINGRDESLLLYADLGPLPTAEQPGRFLARLMTASLFGRATGGAALSLVADGNPDHPARLVLWRTMESEGITAQRLRDRMQAMFDSVVDLREGLSELSDATPLSKGAMSSAGGTSPRGWVVPPLGGMA